MGLVSWWRQYKDDLRRDRWVEETRLAEPEPHWWITIEPRHWSGHSWRGRVPGRWEWRVTLFVWFRMPDGSTRYRQEVRTVVGAAWSWERAERRARAELREEMMRAYDAGAHMTAEVRR